MPSSTPSSFNKQTCRCTDCTCGANCQCTEDLCRCEASSILNSLERGGEYVAEWNIPDMTCQSCVAAIQSVLGRNSVVSLSSHTAKAEVEDARRAEELTQQLQEVGFEATLVSVSEPHERNSRHHGSPTRQAFWMPPSSPPARGKKTNGHDEQQSGLLGESPTIPHDPEDPLSPPPGVSQQQPSSSIQTVEMIIGGMTCSMCSKAVSNAVQQLGENIRSVRVNLSTDLATIEYIDNGGVSISDIKEAIENVGYEVTDVIEPSSENTSSSKLENLTKRQQEHVTARKHAFLFSLVGAVPIFILTMILPHILPTKSIQWMMGTFNLFGRYSIQREACLLWILATPVQFGSGFTFYKTAYHNIQSGQLGMDVLIALGTTASYGYAVSETIAGRDGHFFETSAVLLAFVLLGKWMNALAVRRTSEALTKLMKLQAKVAIRVKPSSASLSSSWDPSVDSYHEETVPIEQIQPNDIVKILRGASIPADGFVSHGEMTVDESMITGESVPVLKPPGSIVLGGTVCVEGSSAFVCVTGVGANTALAQIVQLVEEAQTRQVPIQSLADTISSIFVPTVCTISVLAYMIWYALCMTGVVPEEYYADEGAATFSLMFGIACLVISCPCALGLALPTAVMVGFGVGASYGVLMKGGESLETASKVDSVVFDKTGTLTKSKPSITDFNVLPNVGWDRNYLLWALASLERNSEHPLAAAVVSYAESMLDGDYWKTHPFVQPKDFRALTGRGASGDIGGNTVAVGNRAFADMMDIPLWEQVETLMVQFEQDGKTAILGAVNGTVCVVMGIADEIKPDAAEAIRYLREVMDVEAWMVTGDNSRTARAIANNLGIPHDKVVSEALPVAKVRKVKALQKEGRVVAMIGDGINDSPALAQADVGMSLGTGAEIAAEASDIVLVRGHVMDVCTALDLSQVIFRRIKWNFLWSLLYNCLGIPVAAGVFYPFVHTRLPPTLAGLAMALSSLSVVGSSLALRLYKPPVGVEEASQGRQSSVSGGLDWIRHWWRGSGSERHDNTEDELRQNLLENEHAVENGSERDTSAQINQMEEGNVK